MSNKDIKKLKEVLENYIELTEKERKEINIKLEKFEAAKNKKDKLKIFEQILRFLPFCKIIFDMLKDVASD